MVIFSISKNKESDFVAVTFKKPEDHSKPISVKYSGIDSILGDWQFKYSDDVSLISDLIEVIDALVNNNKFGKYLNGSYL